MILHKDRRYQLSLLLALLAYVLLKEAEALTEEIEATPTNTNGFEIGELSMPQYMLMMLIFLKLVLLYAVGVLPLEIDLGGLWDPDNVFDSDANVVEDEGTRRYGRALPYTEIGHMQKNVSSLNPLMWDCPLQFVCDVDHWANRDHDTFLENYIASWLRYSSNNNTFSSNKARTFAGLPDSCAQMYPCPFDVQGAVGIRIPGAAVLPVSEVDHPDPDAYMSLL